MKLRQMMKKIIITTVFLLSLPLFVVARQTREGERTLNKDTVRRQSVLRAGEKDKLIPLSREQAEVLVAELVSTLLEADSLERQRELDELVMRTKMEALKRKLLDEALARRYNAGLEARLDRLERLLILLLVNNSNIPTDVLQTILSPQDKTMAAPMLQPLSTDTISPAVPDSTARESQKIEEKKPVPVKDTGKKRKKKSGDLK